MPEAVAHRLLPGAYHDSLVLLQLQRRLEALPGVTEAAAVMATAANRALLAERDLLPPAAAAARPDDLLVAVRAADAAAAEAALARVEELLAEGRRAGKGGGEGAGAAGEHRPRTLAAAFGGLPDARWVLVSVPGRWAAGVARDALAAGRHVFLFSDNVPVAEEVALKAEAARRGLLVLGPDCGTAWVAGTGLGFANRVRRGAVGVVAASGSGLQAVACGVHQRGGGISHALGTGGRDLSAEVGGATALAALELLARDPDTRVIVLASKPPEPRVAARLLAAARRTGKPVVVWLIGQAPPGRQIENLRFAGGSDEAAELAVELAGAGASGEAARPGASPAEVAEIGAGGAEAGAAGDGDFRAAAAASGMAADPGPAALGGRWLRALFSGGTLGFEALLGLAPFLAPLMSNLRLPGVEPLPPGAGAPPTGSAGGSGAGSVAAHTLVDLGADELTAGRPHPMLDPALLVERLRAAAADPATRLLLFDVVLGDGAHPDPAAEIAPALGEALAAARTAGRALSAVAVLVGTADDPQDRARQAEALAAAGATVATGVAEAVRYAVAALPMLEHTFAPQPAARSAAHSVRSEPGPPEPAPLRPVPLDALAPPLAAVTVGLAPLHDALLAQEAAAVAVDWRPPAGGDERLARILERAKGRR